MVSLTELYPILAADRLNAIAKIGDQYNLDENYCLYCANKCILGDWRFVCKNCLTAVCRGEYGLPALFISEIFLEMFKHTINAEKFVKKLPLR